MIHGVPKRMWYVYKYLIPSMLEQGINADDITIYNDSARRGNLVSCMNAFLQVDTTWEGTWHLQDDVIISHDFKQKTEEYDSGIVCGFKSKYDGETPDGRVPVTQMWFSFPCIRIPNNIATECSEWVTRYMIGNPVYKKFWEGGVNDDWMFRQFIWQTYPQMNAVNLNPNIVDHVDYLIGGTVNSNARTSVIRSKLWKDEYLVEELEAKLNGR